MARAQDATATAFIALSGRFSALLAGHGSRSVNRPLWHSSCIGLAVVAILSGKYTLGRLLGMDITSVLLEVRFLATAACIVIIFMNRRGLPGGRPNQPLLYIAIGSLAAYYLTGLAHFFYDKEMYFQWRTFLDGSYIIVFLYICTRLLRDDVDLILVALCFEAIALVLAVLAATGVVEASVGLPGAARFTTPITFYRIEFVGFCGAVFLMFLARRPSLSVAHGAAATIFLFAGFETLSRSAFLVGLLVLAIWMLTLAAIGRYRNMLTLAAIAGIAVAAFSLAGADVLVQRISETAPVASLEGPSLRPALTVVPGRETLEDCKARLSEYTEDPAVLGHIDRYSCAPKLVISDRGDGRVYLFFKAIEMFRSEPLFGHGMGSFWLVTKNKYLPVLDVYRYPHSIFLGSLVESGLIGTAAIIISIIAGCILLLRAVTRVEHSLYISGMGLFYLLAANLAGDVYDTRLFWVAVCAVTSVYLAGATDDDDQAGPGARGHMTPDE